MMMTHGTITGKSRRGLGAPGAFAGEKRDAWGWKCSMLIRQTTHPVSTLSVDYGMIGRRQATELLQGNGRRTHARQGPNRVKTADPSRCRSTRYACRRPIHCESQNAMQQVGVGEAVMLSCRRELFALRNVGIGIRFEEIWNAVGREAKVYARISIKLQYSVDAFG